MMINLNPAEPHAPPVFSPASLPVSSAAVRVENVTYDYPGHRALDSVSFALPPATITALVGPNGAGKTTLLRTIAALEPPMRGQIFIGDEDIWENPGAAHRWLGYLPDHFGLYQNLSAHRCLIYAALAHGMDMTAAEQAAKRAAAEVNLHTLLKNQASALSRGQRQRLALAQAIIHRPQILLLDEPASGLDPAAREDISNLMRALAKDGMTILVSSHILAELEDYCGAMLVLEKGRLLAMHALAEQKPASGVLPQSTANLPETKQRRLSLSLAENAAPDFDMDALVHWLIAHESLPPLKCQQENPRTFILTGVLDDTAQVALQRALLIDGWPIVAFGECRDNATHATTAPRLQDIYRKTVSAEGKNA